MTGCKIQEKKIKKSNIDAIKQMILLSKFSKEESKEIIDFLLNEANEGKNS